MSFGGMTKGDVNCDGQVNVIDVVIVINIILDITDPSSDERWAADCNGDDLVNILDAVGIVNVVLGIGTCQP
ncbi:MAG: dockerin type I domain-containing protein [bacterium]